MEDRGPTSLSVAPTVRAPPSPVLPVTFDGGRPEGRSPDPPGEGGPNEAG